MCKYKYNMFVCRLKTTYIICSWESVGDWITYPMNVTCKGYNVAIMVMFTVSAGVPVVTFSTA